MSEQHEEPKKALPQLVLAGVVLDFSSALPLKVADWQALKEQGVTTKSITNTEEVDFAALLKIMAQVMQKAGHKEATETVLAHGLTMLGLTAAINAVLTAEASAVDRPT